MKHENNSSGPDGGLTPLMCLFAAAALAASVWILASDIGRAAGDPALWRGKAEAAEDREAVTSETGSAVEEVIGSPADSGAESVCESLAESMEMLPDEASASVPSAVIAEPVMVPDDAVSAAESVESSAEEAMVRHLICIDPGHQDHGMSETEPNGPGSSEMKAKLTTGTEGTTTGNPEYRINLEVSLRLRDELERRGYEVIMTRETNDVEISNAERAQFASESGAEILLRIHCNGSDNASASGVLCYSPTDANPYLTSDVIEKSLKLSQAVLDGQTAATGQKSQGLLGGDDMTGINWSEIPVTIVEMGFMSNPEEDVLLGSEEGQLKIAAGIADGVDAYFA